MTPTQIGKILRKARGDRSVYSIAKVTGLKRDQITAMEQGTTAHYTIKSLLTLCRELGLKVTFEKKS